MASPFDCLEEELTCPVCHDIFNHPVMLLCSHSFCKGCLQHWWTERPTQDCPVCKKRTRTSTRKPPATNLVLKNLCEKYLEEKRRRASRVSSEELCAAHGEELRLFCRDDEQLACVMCVCDMDKTPFSSVEEASGRFKETVQESLKSLKEKLEVFNKIKTTCNQTRDYIKLQAQNTKTRIKTQFETLHQFLINEESARISALRQEEAQKTLKITERIEELNKDMTSLSDAIRVAEDLLRADDHVSFLRKYKTTMERVRVTLPDPQLLSGRLIDEAQHLGNLAFSVWNKMKNIVSYTPVILDPNTAHEDFILSDDLTSVRFDALKTQQLPDNKERLDTFYTVLGSKGFSSGVHSWDVEVGDWGHWGVLAESYQRKGNVGGESWWLERGSTRFQAFHTSGCTCDSVVLPLKHNPRRIRVRLDWGGGTLSFSDPDTETHLHTFHHTFTETLFPCLSNPRHNTSLKMLPSKICVTLGNG